MFDELETNKSKKPTEEEEDAAFHLQISIVVVVALVLVPFMIMGKAEIGLAVCMSVLPCFLVVRLNWKLRKNIWFWSAIVLSLALELPVALMVPWRTFSINHITLLPFAFAAGLITIGVVKLFEIFFSKTRSSDDEE